MKKLGVWTLVVVALTTAVTFAGDYNGLVLEQIKQMPQGGRYSVSHFAKIRLQSSAHFESGKFFILPSAASPSFCSGATYRLGQNFGNFDQAKPGDFMKIFWSRQVGKNEHGHSTIFLGTENHFGVQYVRYWSSNIPSGYGEKSVPRSKIAYAIFSRLETPANLARISTAPSVDSYLASLLRTRSSIAEAGTKCGL